MEELRKVREHTEKVRQETGALDVRPGEVEGLNTADSSVSAAVLQKSRAQEKRKRELEERRKLLEAKRRKKNPNTNTPEPSSDRETPVFSMPPDDDELDHPPREKPAFKATPKSLDPFAVLEARSGVDNEGKGKESGTAVEDADSFLANLERDIMAKKGS